MRRAWVCGLVIGLAVTAPAAEIKELKDVRKGWWSVQASYPVFAGQGAVARAINAEAKKQTVRGFDEFLKMAREDMPSIKEVGSAATYDYEAGVQVHLEHRDLMSCHWSVYGYTAGAHGSVWFRTLNYGVVGGKVKKLALKDLFLPGVNAVDQTNTAVLAELMKDERFDEVWDFSQSSLDPALLENFVATRDGLLFLFGHYSLAAYVYGVFDVVVPYKNLLGLDPRGPLKPALDAQKR